MAFTNEHLADHQQRLAEADKPLPGVEDIKQAVWAYLFAKSVADRHGTDIETYGAATSLFNEAMRVIMQWLQAAGSSHGSVHYRFEHIVSAVRSEDETAATQLVEQLAKKKPRNSYRSAPAIGGPMYLPQLPKAISDEFEHGAVELQLAYDAALQRTPEEAGTCREVYAVVEQMLHAFVFVYNAIHSRSDEEFCPASLDGSYATLCFAQEQFEALSDLDRARLTTGKPVSYFGSTGVNIGRAVRNAASMHQIVLSTCSLRPTYLGCSKQLRELHPEPWFNVTGYRSAQLLIGSARQDWEGNQSVLNEYSTAQLIDGIVQFVDEVQSKTLNEAGGELYWLKELDAAIACRVNELPDVELGRECSRLGFCRIPYEALVEGISLLTSDGYLKTGPPWRQMMRIMKARCDETILPQPESVAQTTKPRTTQRKSRKGAQSEKIIDYLETHHEYENASVHNYMPAESSDIVEAIKVKPNTLSDFFKNEFPCPNGKPRDGYVNACTNQATLLHWFHRKFDDNLPSPTEKLDDFDPDSVRQKW